MKMPNPVALNVISELKLSYHPKVKASDRPKITESSSAYELLMSVWDQDMIELQEQFYIILLNRNSNVLGICLLSSGGLAGTVVDPKLVFGVALKACASSIILAHNHPSGNLQQSAQDLLMTKKLSEAGKYLDLQIVDHLIVTSESYTSFADEGLM